MSEFRVNVEGSGKLQMILTHYQAKVQSFDRYLPAIGELLIAAVNDIVDMEGPGWDPLKEATLKKRRQSGRGAKMLRDTNTMMDSLSANYGGDHVEVSFGTPYAQYILASKRNPFEIGPVEDGLIEDVSDILMQGLT